MTHTAISPETIPGEPKPSLFTFTLQVIREMRSVGKSRMSEKYNTALNSFRRFRDGCDIPLGQITSQTMLEYEAYLRGLGLTDNTCSFYMRNLRAIYNRAVDKGLVSQAMPFRNVYTGVDKTLKRAINVDAVRVIKRINLSKYPMEAFARDMFLFSFYTRGMSFVDMAFLRKTDLRMSTLSYRRRKTGQLLSMRWDHRMQAIIDRHPAPQDSPFLLPIINNPTGDRWKQYKNAMHNVNRALKNVGVMSDLEENLTMYVARHAWASIAHSNNIPIAVISSGLGHDSERTTRIYLASIDTAVIDNANETILQLLD
ncbi:MAG TPA: integrase [Porphyromonadaceae bacterium]|nr:integrase [Porphyromonadaceae bacterium]